MNRTTGQTKSNQDSMETVKKIDRHCAFCHTLVPAGEVKLCGGCRRRAYCGKDCQLKDWKPKAKKGQGQGHKDWCSVPCGEEDLDWAVVPVPGKGLGLVALRLIPARTRILVDGQDNDWRSEVDVDVVDRSKFSRSCYLNHECDSNAGGVPREMAVLDQVHYEFDGMIIYSKKDIHPGQEIVMNYVNFLDISRYTRHPPEQRSWSAQLLRLRTKDPVVCPEGCICTNTELERRVQEARPLFESVHALLFHGEHVMTPNVAMRSIQTVQRLVGVHAAVGGCWADKTRILDLGVEIGKAVAEAPWTKSKKERRILKIAREFAKENYEIWCSISNPKYKNAVEAEKALKAIEASF